MKENRVLRIREIGSLQVHIGYLTFSLKKPDISTFFECKLVPPKKKDNGIRPVAVGECLWWIIGKTITGLIRKDHAYSGNTTDMCETGIKHRSSNTCCKDWVKDFLLFKCSYLDMHKTILKQHTQHLKDYPPDGPISKEQCEIRVNYLNHLKTLSEINWVLLS